jgi:hypothetical protein
MITHLDDALLGNLHEKLQEQYNFHGLMLDMVAAGYCDSCWQILQQNEPQIESSQNPPESPVVPDE